jgi:hypothetical protein
MNADRHFAKISALSLVAEKSLKTSISEQVSALAGNDQGLQQRLTQKPGQLIIDNN